MNCIAAIHFTPCCRCWCGKPEPSDWTSEPLDAVGHRALIQTAIPSARGRSSTPGARIWRSTPRGTRCMPGVAADAGGRRRARQQEEAWVARGSDADAGAAPAAAGHRGTAGSADNDTRQLLQMAAVIGQDVPLDLWKQVSDADDDALLTAIERGADSAADREGMPDGVATVPACADPGGTLRGDSSRCVVASAPAIGEALSETPNPDPDIRRLSLPSRLAIDVRLNGCSKQASGRSGPTPGRRRANASMPPWPSSHSKTSAQERAILQTVLASPSGSQPYSDSLTASSASTHGRGGTDLAMAAGELGLAALCQFTPGSIAALSAISARG